MPHRARVLPLLLITAAAFTGACKKNEPEVTPTPLPTPVEDAGCDQRCQDSIANARRVADSIAAANAASAEMARAMEAARSALTAVIYFDYDASDIRVDSRSTLEAKVPVLTANPSVRLRIAGHTDSRGSDEYNLALGQRRAAAAKQFLTDRGIEPSRIEIVSLGEERPADPAETEAAFARNRRAEFEIIAGGTDLQPPR